MQFRISQFSFLMFALLLYGFPIGKNAENKARLFVRYEQGASYNRIGEILLSLRSSISSKERATVAVRVCSKEPMAFAMAKAGADPFLVADILGDYGYSSERILFLRSEDCLSKSPLSTATEIWTIPEGAALPSHVEAFKSSHIKLIPLGKELGRLGMRDYKSALNGLLERLRTTRSSTGLVVGYILKKPSPSLRVRMREVTRILKRSGIPNNRYLVRIIHWPDEISEHPPEPEAQYPNISVIELSKGSN